MRLLSCLPDGGFRLTSFDGDSTPLYAILSHTWTEGQEVTYDELLAGTGAEKDGYAKIGFCGDRAAKDGLEYFWVDTCCIDTTDKAEHSWAIRSMFRWYCSAAKCYVYLSDMSTEKRKAGSTSSETSWEPAFRLTRWFKRGWTLQELIAPNTVEFFTQEGNKLGDKVSLQLLIHKTTGIPLEVLNGAPLSQFSVNERLRWAEGRITKHEEDRAYSLQGILDIELAPVYGEGVAGAFERLRGEINKLERCIQDLRQTDPRDDKKRIVDTKGGLLEGSYRWVLDHSSFKQWRSDPRGRLLWIKGDPSKGKTMLLCGAIEELGKSSSANLSFFFCQGTNSSLNNATTVLRGLLYLLISQQPSLASHLQKRYD
jgi:hypothetical protein